MKRNRDGGGSRVTRAPTILNGFTLQELDAKTKAMLKLIERNAHSFAQRAETYYKKRPELITFVQDFNRPHRSLAERFDHLKSSDLEDGEIACSDTSFREEEGIQISCIEDDTWNQERLKLIQESEAMRKQLLEKDEEKREVIRQLSLTHGTLKDDNLRLQRRLAHESLKKRSVLEIKPFHNFLGKHYRRGSSSS